MSYTTSSGNKMMSASMRLGSSPAYIAFEQGPGGFSVTANVPGREGQPDQAIAFTLNDAQRQLLRVLLGGVE